MLVCSYQNRVRPLLKRTIHYFGLSAFSHISSLFFPFLRMLVVDNSFIFSPRSNSIKIFAYMHCSSSICTIQGAVGNVSLQSCISTTGYRLPQISKAVLNMLLGTRVDVGFFGVRSIFRGRIKKVVIHIHDDILDILVRKTMNAILGTD